MLNSNRISRIFNPNWSLCWLSISILSLSIVHGANLTDDNKCGKWLRAHASLTRDYDYFNISRFLKFTFKAFDELGHNCSSQANASVINKLSHFSTDGQQKTSHRLRLGPAISAGFIRIRRPISSHIH